METKELNSMGEQLTSSTQKPSRYQALLLQTKERELLHGHDLDSLLPILQQASENIRATLDSALVCVIDWFQDSNSRRLTGLFKRKDVVQIQERQQMLAKQLKELEAALSEFRLVERKKLIKPYEKFFDPDTKLLVKRADMFASRYIINIAFDHYTHPTQGRCMFASYLSIPSMLSQNAWLICSRSSLVSILRDQQSKSGFQAESLASKIVLQVTISRARKAHSVWEAARILYRSTPAVEVPLIRRQVRSQMGRSTTQARPRTQNKKILRKVAWRMLLVSIYSSASHTSNNATTLCS